VGSDSVTAVLAADSNYASVISNVQPETVIDFSIAATPASQTVNPGAGTTYTIALSGISGAFTSPVTLTVTGLPPGATVSFGEAVYIPGVGPTPTTMTVVTSATQGRVISPSGHTTELYYGLMLLPLLGSRKLRRKLRQMPGGVISVVLALALLGGVAATTSCGGGYFGGPPQQYTITVTGTSGTLSHSTTVMLTVK
jgi:hypothetical protein